MSTSSPSDRKRKRSMYGIAERIKNSGHFAVDLRIMPPNVAHGQRDEFGKSARPVYANALGMRAKMTAARQTIAAAAANHVAFAADHFAGMKIIDVGTHLDNFANELMADRHGNRNGARAQSSHS